jgi:hypothetical protein
MDNAFRTICFVIERPLYSKTSSNLRSFESVNLASWGIETRMVCDPSPRDIDWP